jgi:hypothetical protein
MRGVRNLWRWVVWVLLGLTGCVHHPQADLKPNRPEDYTLPPANLYNKPPEIPKEYMNQFPQRKDTNLDDAPPPNPGGMQRMGAPGRPM